MPSCSITSKVVGRVSIAPHRLALAVRSNSVVCKLPGTKCVSFSAILKMVREARGRKHRFYARFWLVRLPAGKEKLVSRTFPSGEDRPRASEYIDSWRRRLARCISGTGKDDHPIPSKTSMLPQKVGHHIGTPELLMMTSCTKSNRPCAMMLTPTSVGRKMAPRIATVENTTAITSSPINAWPEPPITANSTYYDAIMMSTVQ